jgi:hypothetical protein
MKRKKSCRDRASVSRFIELAYSGHSSLGGLSKQVGMSRSGSVIRSVRLRSGSESKSGRSDQAQWRAQFYSVSKSGERVSTRTEGERQELADIILCICNCDLSHINNSKTQIGGPQKN